MIGKTLMEKFQHTRNDSEKVSVSLKVDRYGNVYAAPLNEGEHALSFDEVSALAASRR